MANRLSSPPDAEALDSRDVNCTLMAFTTYMLVQALGLVPLGLVALAAPGRSVQAPDAILHCFMGSAGLCGLAASGAVIAAMNPLRRYRCAITFGFYIMVSAVVVLLSAPDLLNIPYAFIAVVAVPAVLFGTSLSSKRLRLRDDPAGALRRSRSHYRRGKLQARSEELRPG